MLSCWLFWKSLFVMVINYHQPLDTTVIEKVLYTIRKVTVYLTQPLAWPVYSFIYNHDLHKLEDHSLRAMLLKWFRMATLFFCFVFFYYYHYAMSLWYQEKLFDQIWNYQRTTSGQINILVLHLKSIPINDSFVSYWFISEISCPGVRPE